MTKTMPSQIPLPPTSPSAVGKQPTILLFGDSHSHAIHLAVEDRVASGRPVPLAVFRQLKEKNERKVGNISFDGFLKRITDLTRKDVVLSVMGGSRHALYGTIQHPQPFDFFLPDRGGAITAELDVIPYRTLQTLFAEGIYERVGRKLKKMRSATKARVVHLIPPPPKGNNEYIAHHHEKSYARHGIATLGISPPELRLKFWLLQARVLSKICRNLGVGVMMPPKAATYRGFLRPEYFAEDTTHANERYGELVLCAVEAEFF